MCGIWFSSGFSNISNKQLEIVSHRGPDYCNMIKISNSIAIGHNRLSIIDLNPRSNQPMFSKDKNHIIVFNGEIYNYLELRDELEKLGHVFYSTGDTEVLLHSYLQWGKNCLHKFNGMFVFLIFEKSTNKIFVARDRFGIKPIYFYQDGDKIAFGSEIKQFTTLKGFKPKININRAVDFISWKIFNHTNETMFENVYQLRGGQYIEISIKSINGSLLNNVDTWYSYNNLMDVEQNTFDEEQNIINFRNYLKKSVELRLRSDVPIATALSGGIDSSSLCSLVENISPNSQTVFSSRSKNPELDEYAFAKDVIYKNNIKAHHQFFVEQKNIFDEIEDVVWYNDEPIASTSIVAQSKLFKKISSEKFKVVLNGQGADEVIGTYGQINPFYNELKNKGLISRLFREVYLYNQNNNFVYRILRTIKQLLTSNSNNLFPNSSIDIINRSYLNNKLNPHNYLASEMGLDINASLKDYNIFILYTSSLPMLLQYDDRTSMRYSVESRVPYLDYKFVENVMSISSLLKINNGVNKYILRQSLKDIIPNNIYNRRTKLGYATDQLAWSKLELKKEMIDRIKSACYNYSFINENKINYLLTNYEKPGFNSICWRIVIFDIWAQRYGVV